MDAEDFLPRRTDDLVAQLGRQDLDPLSVEELTARIDALQAEIARCRDRIGRATGHRTTADALFKR